jgi:hypothetical protein
MMGIAASREGKAAVVHYDRDSHYDGDSGDSGTVMVARDDEFPPKVNAALLQPPRRKLQGPGRVTKEISDKVMWFHKILNHRPGNRMASSLRSQAWVGVDITPMQIEQVYLAHDCETCMLSRHNNYIALQDQVAVLKD